MAMTFTLVSHLREQLSDLAKAKVEKRKREEKEKERLALEVCTAAPDACMTRISLWRLNDRNRRKRPGLAVHQ